MKLKTNIMLNQATQIENSLKTLSNSEVSEYKDLKVLNGVNAEGKFVLRIWKGRQSAPFYRVFFHTVEALGAAMLKELAYADKRAAYKAERRKAPEFQVGDIYVSSWGYEQTNVDAYEVIAKPSKHFAVVVEIKLERIAGTESINSVSVKPLKGERVERPWKVDKIGSRKKVTGDSIKISDSITAYKWDGERSFYKSWGH